MKKLRMFITVLALSIFSASYAEVDNAARDYVDYLEENNIPYVIMTRLFNGQQQLVIITLANPTLQHVNDATLYDSFGMDLGTLGVNPFETLGDLIDRIPLSAEDSCQLDLTCYSYISEAMNIGPQY